MLWERPHNLFCGGSQLREPSPTLDSLTELGFRPKRPESPDIIGYEFGNLELTAMHPDITNPTLMALAPSAFRPSFDFEYLETMNKYGGYVVWVTGTVATPRSISEVESPIPPDLGSASEAAAWVSYVLRFHRSDLGPLPDWFLEGERDWDLVPPAQKERLRQAELREREEKWQAYKASPKCFIDRDYALVLRRNMRQALSELAGVAEMTLKFDGRVLSISLRGSVNEVATPTISERRALRRSAIASGEYLQEVVASGNSWPSSYQVLVSPETTLPDKLTGPMVEVNVFEGYVQLDGHRLGPSELIA